MRRLLLLRHAKTEANAPSGRDFDRSLDARGFADAEQIGQWLAKQSDAPSRVLVSSAKRAQQTWDSVKRQFADPPQAVEVESLYNAMPNDLLAAIDAHGEDASPLMLVAHNPGLHEIALAMTGSGDGAAQRALSDNLPTSGLVILDFDAATWAAAGFRRGCLVNVVTPKILNGAE